MYILPSCLTSSSQCDITKQGVEKRCAEVRTSLNDFRMLLSGPLDLVQKTRTMEYSTTVRMNYSMQNPDKSHKHNVEQRKADTKEYCEIPFISSSKTDRIDL